MRIAMWSGPRNLSTAMMYSFGARSDFAVVDEPFYAAYLALSGLDHPMRDDIIASQPTDPAVVIDTLLGPIPGNKPRFYQKHMTHHMLPGMFGDWMSDLLNVFLIRHPARVAASYVAKHEDITLSDIGVLQQAELFDQLTNTGKTPVVIDSADIRRDPETMLRRLCNALDLPWDPAMLSWSAGPHPNDGVWANHWYGAVHQSTGFAPAEGDLPLLETDQQVICDAALPAFEHLKRHKL